MNVPDINININGDILMDFRDLYAGKYLNTSDVKEKPFRGTIVRAKAEEMKDGKVKAVIYFEGRDRGLVLNGTRHDTLIQITGSANSEDWIGTKIDVRDGMTNYGGKPTGCIVISKPAVKKTAEQKAAEVKEELNDDLPDFE